MDIIDFTKSGGYRLEQPTLSKMQESFFWILKSFIGFLKVPDIGNFIVCGCVIEDANITEGIMYIDGEICPFAEIAGTIETKIKKLVALEGLSFENGTTPLVWRNTKAVEDAAGTKLEDFIRLKIDWNDLANMPVGLVLDENYVHTDENFTSTFKTKLESLAIQLQSDFNQTDNTKKDFIKNKPLVPVRVGRENIGDISSVDQAKIINFTPLGTVNYIVIPVMVCNDSNFADSNDISWVVFNKTASSFTIGFREYANATQNLTVEYVIYLL